MPGPEPHTRSSETKGGAEGGGACWAPTCTSGPAHLAEGDCPAGRVRACRLRCGSSDSDICARPAAFRAGGHCSFWLGLALLCTPSRGLCCAAPWALLPRLPFSDQNWGLEQLVSADPTPKWRKALCRRGEQAKERILINQTWSLGFSSVFPLTLL